MSENELLERIRQNVANPMISTDIGLAAAQEIGKTAAQENIAWALAGGLAMYLYGSPRLTKDVDIVASGHLSLSQNGPLGFGGSNYLIKVGKYEVAVDWIVRNDGYAKYYRAALRDAVTLPEGARVLTPEWLVVLKMFAGRQKDYDDAVFLLSQKDLVSRPQVRQHIINAGSEDAWLAVMPSFRRLCSLADGKVNEPDKYTASES